MFGVFVPLEHFQFWFKNCAIIECSMKKILGFSISINLILIIFFGYFIYKKGGINYIIIKLGFNPDLSIQDSPNWINRKTLFEILPNDTDEIIFLGDSHTNFCEWAELFKNPKIKNRGIGGDNTEGILYRLSEITESHPQKIFIEIGSNDLNIPRNTFCICNNYKSIIDYIKLKSPDTRIYIQSELPKNIHPNIKNDSILVLNQKIKKLANDNSLTFIDLYNKLLDGNGNLNMQLTYDGVHLNGKGYLIWKEAIEYFVNEP